MRTLTALLVALPLAAAAQAAPPPGRRFPRPRRHRRLRPPPPSRRPSPRLRLPSPSRRPAGLPPPPVAAPSTGPKRDSWYIGFGLGSGGGKVKDETGSYSLSEGMSDPVTVSSTSRWA